MEKDPLSRACKMNFFGQLRGPLPASLIPAEDLVVTKQGKKEFKPRSYQHVHILF